MGLRPDIGHSEIPCGTYCNAIFGTAGDSATALSALSGVLVRQIKLHLQNKGTFHGQELIKLVLSTVCCKLQ